MKHTQHTKVIINGVDVFGHILACNLPRRPFEAETVELILCVDRLAVEDDTLVVYVNTEDRG